jgi:hypothetical protein
MCRHARSLTCSRDRPGGPPRHFCGATTTRSAGQPSKSHGSPPNEETASTSSSAPFVIAAATPATSVSVPDGVSQWTAATTVMSGLRASASLTCSGAMVVSYPVVISMTSAASRRASRPNALP